MIRDTYKESLWVNHTLIGYIPLDKDGTPYRVTKIVYNKEEKQPPRIYKTIQMAIKQSPFGYASEVRIFTQIEGANDV